MAFTFGPLLPVIFVYAFFGMVILYATLRLRIAYSVKRFPNYDRKMNKAMILCLRFCPLIYSLISGWLYSNQQVMKNTVLANESHSSFNADSGHTLSQIFTQLTPGTIFFLMSFCLLLQTAYLLAMRFCPAKFSCCCPRIGHSKYYSGSDFEKIGTKKENRNFYEVLTDTQKESLLREEAGNRMRTGIAHLSEDSIKKLMLAVSDGSGKEPSGTSHKLVGFYSYDILADRDNCQRFEYVPCFYPDRTKRVISPSRKGSHKLKSVDLVRLAVDFAYMDEAKAKDFSFSSYLPSTFH